jgi:hypothetical protein
LKPYRQIFWGLRHKLGVLLIGHNYLPMLYRKRSEAAEAKNSSSIIYNKDWKVVKLILSEQAVDKNNLFQDHK